MVGQKPAERIEGPSFFRPQPKERLDLPEFIGDHELGVAIGIELFRFSRDHIAADA